MTDSSTSPLAGQHEICSPHQGQAEGSPLRVFVAGASGAIGIRLVPLLIQAGYAVTGTTRSPERVRRLAALGAQPAVVDVFDAPALHEAVKQARPHIVIHQLTDLSLLATEQRSEAYQRNARIRIEGTRNLISAANSAGAQKLIAQSIAWLYAPGAAEPHTEADPLQTPAEGPAGASVRGVLALEHQTLESPPLVGTVLRYGWLYGPGTGTDTPGGTPGVHVDAAASAALLATQSPHHGIFNVAEPSGYLSTERARRELGWDPAFRLGHTLGSLV
jgi:nucleoside-diphosphate-sugar epimerase